MNKILALHTSHDGSLTYVVDNEIIFHTQLDRFNRFKHTSFPVKYLLDLIKSLDFNTFIITRHYSSSSHNIWSSFFEKMKDTFIVCLLVSHTLVFVFKSLTLHSCYSF